MRITDEAKDLHKLLKAKNIEITREQILEVLMAQSEKGQFNLSRGEPFEVYKIGTIIPKITNGISHFKKKEEESGRFVTVTFTFKVAAEIKRQAKDRIPKV